MQFLPKTSRLKYANLEHVGVEVDNVRRFDEPKAAIVAAQATEPYIRDRDSSALRVQARRRCRDDRMVVLAAGVPTPIEDCHYADELEEVFITPWRYAGLVDCAPKGSAIAWPAASWCCTENAPIAPPVGLAYYETRIAALDPSALDDHQAVGATIPRGTGRGATRLSRTLARVVAPAAPEVGRNGLA